MKKIGGSAKGYILACVSKKRVKISVFIGKSHVNAMFCPLF